MGHAEMRRRLRRSPLPDRTVKFYLRLVEEDDTERRAGRHPGRTGPSGRQLCHGRAGLRFIGQEQLDHWFV